MSYVSLFHCSLLFPKIFFGVTTYCFFIFIFFFFQMNFTVISWSLTKCLCWNFNGHCMKSVYWFGDYFYSPWSFIQVFIYFFHEGFITSLNGCWMLRDRPGLCCECLGPSPSLESAQSVGSGPGSTLGVGQELLGLVLTPTSFPLAQVPSHLSSWPFPGQSLHLSHPRPLLCLLALCPWLY